MLGQRIRSLRKEKKITQQDLANYLKLGKSTISQYENNINEPDTTTIQKIADFFNVSVDYLFGRTDEPLSVEKVATDKSNFIDEEGPLTEEEKEYLKESLKLFRRMKAKWKE